MKKGKKKKTKPAKQLRNTGKKERRKTRAKNLLERSPKPALAVTGDRPSAVQDVRFVPFTHYYSVP